MIFTTLCVIHEGSFKSIKDSVLEMFKYSLTMHTPNAKPIIFPKMFPNVLFLGTVTNTVFDIGTKVFQWSILKRVNFQDTQNDVLMVL